MLEALFSGPLRQLQASTPLTYQAGTLCNSRPPIGISPTLRLLSWNLLAPCYVRQRESDDEWQARAQKQIATVEELDCDVIGLQEFWSGNPKYVDLWRGFAESHDFIMHVCPRVNGKPDGCAMLVRQPTTCSFSAYTFDDWGSRIVQAASVQLPGSGDPLVLMQTHLTFPHQSAHDPLMRYHQGRKLGELIRMQSGSAPLCVFGDFNGPLSDPALVTLAERGGLRAPPDRPTNGEVGRTWASHLAHTGDLMACDHVLTRGACQVREWSLGGRHADLVEGKLSNLASDHRPVVATLELGAAALEAVPERLDKGAREGRVQPQDAAEACGCV